MVGGNLGMQVVPDFIGLWLGWRGGEVLGANPFIQEEYIRRWPVEYLIFLY